MKTRAEHVVVHDGSKKADAYMLECLNCGTVQRFALPIAVGVWVAAAKAFEKLHKNCKGKERGKA